MTASSGAPNGRLDSWKAIAAYLGRGVRTVQRWEREEGLPVHRLPHAKRGTVYAQPDELDGWWASRGASLRDAEGQGDNRAPGVSTWTRFAIIGATLAALLAIAAVAAMRSRSPVGGLTLQRVTSATGLTLMPALSPDGRMVAYASDGGQDGTPLQIWAQQIGSSAGVPLTKGPAVHTGPSFSGDGTRILFTRTDGVRTDIYDIATLGGEPRLLIPDGGTGRFSPDGRWLVYSGNGEEYGVHLATSDGKPVRSLTAGLFGGRWVVWSPDSTRLLVLGRRAAATEADIWVVPIDGAPPADTGLLRALRTKGFDTQWAPMATWVAADAIVFSGRNSAGWSLWRQRITSDFRLAGDPERVTTGTAIDWWPTFAAGRLAYVSSHADSNLWSLPADTRTGVVAGPMRRLTRGSGITAYPSLSDDGRLLAFASDRAGNWDVYLNDLAGGTRRVLAGGAERQMYSVINPAGSQIAFGVVTSDARVRRPVYIAAAEGGAVRRVCEDCNGRPRDWLRDGRHLVLERFSRVNSVAIVETATGTQRQLLESAGRSVSDPRVSPDGRWIAFTAGERDRAPQIYVARIGATAPVPESQWGLIATAGRHPFWSPDGRLVYFVSGSAFGSQIIRARRFDPESGVPEREAFDVYRLEGNLPPVQVTSGVRLVASGDQIVVTLADFRGDVWVTDVRDER